MKPNPHQCQQTNDPQRHFNCLHYDQCLTLAAHGRWDGFTCAACGFMKSVENASLALTRIRAQESRRSSGDLHELKKKTRNLAVLTPRRDNMK